MTEYGTFKEMEPRRIYFPEDVKHHTIWTGMEPEGSPTITDIWAFFNEFRRGNSAMVAEWFKHPMAGYSLAGIAVLEEPKFFFIYRHDEDVKDAENPRVTEREAIFVEFSRTMLPSGQWDIDVNVGKAEWMETAPETAEPGAADELEFSEPESKLTL